MQDEGQDNGRNRNAITGGKSIIALPTATTRIVAFDYIRIFAIVLVVLQHSVLAYVTYIDFDDEDPLANFSPIVDDKEWVVFDPVTGVNDTFLMPLLFFVSGLFVWSSMKRKGIKKFLRDRHMKLGIPFLIGVPLWIPLAYYPTQLVIDDTTTYFEFWSDVAKDGFWAPGPLWFLWLLIVFIHLFIRLYRRYPHIWEIAHMKTSERFNQPSKFYMTMVVLTTLAYLPLFAIFGPVLFIGIGPFLFQVSRIFVYLLYFLVGSMVGAYGIHTTMFTRDSTLSRNWWKWLLGGVLFELVFFWSPFTLACPAICLGVIGFFLRFTGEPNRAIKSLSRNSFGIYIVHYPIVTWLQYGLLEVDLPASAKGVIVFVGTFLLSWGLVPVIRHIPGVEKISSYGTRPVMSSSLNHEATPGQTKLQTDQHHVEEER